MRLRDKYSSACFTQYFSYIATIQPTQNKTKQLGWCGNIISKKTPPLPQHHHTGMTTIEATSRQPKKLSFDMQPFPNTNKINMEDDLNIFLNHRQPHYFDKGRWPYLFGRQPQKIIQLKTVKSRNNFILKIEDDLKHLLKTQLSEKGRRPLKIMQPKTK